MAGRGDTGSANATRKDRSQTRSVLTSEQDKGRGAKSGNELSSWSGQDDLTSINEFMVEKFNLAKESTVSEVERCDIGTNLSQVNSDLLTSASHYDSDQLFSQPMQPVVTNGALNLDINERQSQTMPKLKKDLSSKTNSTIGLRKGVNSKKGVKYSNRGYVVALKDTFGFIEEEDGQRELFFHYSTYDGDVNDLELGQVVEYNVSHKKGKLTPFNVRNISVGKQPEEYKSEVLTGVVTRTVRTFNHEQNEYTGVITVDDEKESGEAIEYEFSMISLNDINEFIQKGDIVEFQVGYNRAADKERAVVVKPIRNKLQASDCPDS